MAGRHRYLGPTNLKLPFKLRVDGASGIVQGDMVAWDGTNKKAITMPTGTGILFAGVSSDDESVSGGSSTTVIDKLTEVGIYHRGVFSFKTTGGDTYLAGDVVYRGADAQTVQKTSTGLTKIGVIELPPDQQLNGVAGGAGVSVTVRITPPWPDAIA
jgi:hypothetical protein